jgi:hypothetical protein
MTTLWDQPDAGTLGQSRRSARHELIAFVLWLLRPRFRV